MTELCDLLVIGGRSGVGKSAVGFEVSAQRGALGARHALIEGDFMDFPTHRRASTTWLRRTLR